VLLLFVIMMEDVPALATDSQLYSDQTAGTDNDISSSLTLFFVYKLFNGFACCYCCCSCSCCYLSYMLALISANFPQAICMQILGLVVNNFAFPFQLEK